MAFKNKGKISVDDSVTGETFIIPELRLKQELFFTVMDISRNRAEYAVLKRNGYSDEGSYRSWVKGVEHLFLLLYDSCLAEEIKPEVKEILNKYYEKIIFDEAKLSDKDYKGLMKYLFGHMYETGLMDLRIKTPDYLTELRNSY